MPRIISTHVHPMRYMRNRPFARKVVQRYRRLVGRGMPTMDALNDIAAILMEAYNSAIDKRPREKRPERPTAMVTQEVSLACHVGAFTEHGRNIFYLEPHMVELLDHTDLASVRCGDIRLPFDCSYVSFGDALDLALPGPPNRIDGAYLTAHPDHDVVQVLVTSRRLDVRSPDNATQWPFSRDLYFYAPLQMSDPDATIEDAVQRAIATGDIKVEAAATEQGDGDLVHQEFIRDVSHLTDAEQTARTKEGLPAFRRALALVMNALCYLNSTEDSSAERQLPGDTPTDLATAWTSPKAALRDRAKAGLLDRGFMPVTIRRSTTSTTCIGLRQGESIAGAPVMAHWRRGHWRRQPHGAGRASIKLVWIRPTLVGASDGGEAPGHVYRIC